MHEMIAQFSPHKAPGGNGVGVVIYIAAEDEALLVFDAVTDI